MDSPTLRAIGTFASEHGMEYRGMDLTVNIKISRFWWEGKVASIWAFVENDAVVQVAIRAPLAESGNMTMADLLIWDNDKKSVDVSLSGLSSIFTLH